MVSSRGRDHSDAHPSDLLYKTTIQEKDSGLGRNSENRKNDTSVANLEKHQQTLSDDIQILSQWEEQDDYAWKPAELPKQNAWFPVRPSSPLSTSTTTPSSSSVPIIPSSSTPTGQTSTTASSDLEDDQDELHGASEHQTRGCRLVKHQADGRLESTGCASETVLLQLEYGSRDGQNKNSDGADGTANEDAMPLENTGASATSLTTPAAEPSHQSHANPRVETGPSGPPLRTVTNTSAAQSSQRSGSTSSRLTSSKTGSGSGWGNASFMQPPPRDDSAAGQMDSYAQTVNAPQPNRSLNLSADEYPSLGKGPQLQSQIPGTGAWPPPNAWDFKPAKTQTQRQQPSGPSNNHSANRQRPDDRDASFPSAPGQTQAPGRQSTNSSEDTRRSNTMQSDGFPSSTFGSRMPSSLEIQRSVPDGDATLDRLSSPQSASGLPSSRSPISQVINGAFGPDRTTTGPALPTIGQRPGPSQDSFAGRHNMTSPISGDQAAAQNLEETLNNMSSRDRWGLAGFFASYQDPATQRLMRGQDLNTLGPRLDSSEPLHQRFLGPFATEGSVPRPLKTDYVLPACYEIKNIVPLPQRVNSFTEETLFYIFYTMPRDIMQEIVAEELMGRKWRFHIPLRLWLTRDENAPPPVEVEPGVSESGTYLWWIPNGWRRERRPFILRYEDLDDHLSRTGGVNGQSIAGSANGGSSLASGFAPSAAERPAVGAGRAF